MVGLNNRGFTMKFKMAFLLMACFLFFTGPANADNYYCTVTESGKTYQGTYTPGAVMCPMDTLYGIPKEMKASLQSKQTECKNREAAFKRAYSAGKCRKM